MQEIRNSARSGSEGSVGSQDGNSEQLSERENNGTSVRLGKQEIIDRIHSANRKVRLIDVITSYGIHIQRNSYRSDWSVNIICPFKSHKGGNERTPSFGYSYKDDRFYCYGCQRGGRAIEFIWEYEGRKRSRLSIANDILRRYEDDVSDFDYDEEDPMFEGILFGLADFLREHSKKHRDDQRWMASYNKIMWSLDSVLASKLSKNKISVEEIEYLSSRIKKLVSL